MPVQEAQEEDEEEGERWSDRGVSVCLLLQESEEVDEEAGFGKSTEGERESEIGREKQREIERETESVARSRSQSRCGFWLCVCGCVRVGSDLALVGGGGRNQELVRCLGCCVLEASSTIGRRGRCTT